jgi:hypothetical protein
MMMMMTTTKRKGNYDDDKVKEEDDDGDMILKHKEIFTPTHLMQLHMSSEGGSPLERATALTAHVTFAVCVVQLLVLP